MLKRTGINGVLALGWLAACAVSCAMEYNLPKDANIVDVKRDFGAKGDGETDDTEAIRKAIKHGIEKSGRYAAPSFVYFPVGTYLVSGPLESRVANDGWSGGWRAGMILVGQHRDRSIIKLKDTCEGYSDAAKPRYLIATGSECDKRGKGIAGGGNRAFRHSLINLTVDTGSGNPGAVAIDYVASNRGAIEDVLIRSGDGAGFCGLRLERWWPGPALIKRVHIDGFDYGIRTQHWQYSMTFEDIRLTNQRKVAVVNPKNALFMRKVVSRNKVPFYVGAGMGSFLVLLDSEIEGPGEKGIAFQVKNKGRALLRNVKVSKYATALKDENKGAKGIAVEEGGTTIRERSVGGVKSLFDSPKRSLNLPVKETPEFHSSDLEKWVSVVEHGATRNAKGVKSDDDADGIQAAIDSGKPIVYLPNGTYTLKKTLIIRGQVRKIIGLQSGIGSPKSVKVDPLIRFEGGDADAVILEHLRIDGSVEHASSKALAFRHVDFKGYRNTAKGTGDMFFEDTIGKPIRVLHPQSVWGRQVNCEFGKDPLVENHGGKVWILGLKTEGQTMNVIKTVKGHTELLGALIYPLRQGTKDIPMFVNDRGHVSLSYRMNGKEYPVHMHERRGEEWKKLPFKAAGHRGMPLYTGYQGDTPNAE